MSEAAPAPARIAGAVETIEQANSLPVLLLEVAVILVTAKAAGHVARKFGQPGILGELTAGVVLGVLSAFILPSEIYQIFAASMSSDSHVAVLGELGILLLLFRVGLECRPRDLLRVGLSASAVAACGVLLPLLLGFVVCQAFSDVFGDSAAGWQMHLFVGATMAATSVGVTARVLEEIGKLHRPESQIILGAAIIDDILGLLLLAVVSGAIAMSGDGTASGLGAVALTAAIKALSFVLAGTLFGIWFAKRYLRVLERLEGPGAHAAGLLAFCLVFSAMAEFAGLAPLVGAFVAGLVIDDPPRQEAGGNGTSGRGERELAPLTTILAPIFFVLMGMQVQVGSMFSIRILLFTAGITVVAFLGKFVAGFLVRGSFASKAFVGAGMVPRGEVGLIFAAVGRATGTIGEHTFSALVVMVILTTLAGPALLKRAGRSLPDEKLAAAPPSGEPA